MFLSYEMRECQGCDSIAEAISLIDKRLVKLTTALYHHHVFLSKSPNLRRIKDLIHYRAILYKLSLNSEFYPNYSFKQIVSKVKTLV